MKLHLFYCKKCSNRWRSMQKSSVIEVIKWKNIISNLILPTLNIKLKFKNSIHKSNELIIAIAIKLIWRNLTVRWINIILTKFEFFNICTVFSFFHNNSDNTESKKNDSIQVSIGNISYSLSKWEREREKTETRMFPVRLQNQTIALWSQTLTSLSSSPKAWEYPKAAAPPIGVLFLQGFWIWSTKYIYNRSIAKIYVVLHFSISENLTAKKFEVVEIVHLGYIMIREMGKGRDVTIGNRCFMLSWKLNGFQISPGRNWEARDFK